MKLAISNIAWDADADEAMAHAICAHQGHGVELAPTKYFPELNQATQEKCLALRARWEDQGVPIVATQSLLFGQPGLQVFGDEATRRRARDFLRVALQVGAWLGAGAQVFGSPKNRLKGPLSQPEAMERAADFFRPLGRFAAELGTCLVMEPNPPAYGCDFVTTAAEGAELVRRVASPGFQLHLDAAAMQLAGDDGPAAIRAYAPLLGHFHLSAPQLGPVGPDAGIGYKELTDALSGAGYDRWVSIEMRNGGGDGAAAAATALAYIRDLTAGRA